MVKARILTLVVSLVLLLALLPSRGSSIMAQGPEPPSPHKPLPGLPPLPHGPYQTPDGLWMMPADARSPVEATGVTPQATGGPDDFGYTWDDSVTLNWIDAASGTDTGMSGGSWDQASGPVSLPFSFKYYENTYNQVYIAASGYLAFADAGYWPSQGPIPSPSEPNNTIAPYRASFELASSGTSGRVFYTSGGIAPNRYFVVQWNQVGNGDEGPHTFEVILHERGDIVFQYGTMTYATDRYWCASAGIEDSAGLDGLTYVRYCGRIWQDHKAVRFYRPAPSARVSAHPLHQGRFARAGETATFQIPIRNTGELGADTYDITTVSTWPVSLYAADGTTPLTDTDGDGTVDTGSVAQGATLTIVAKVTTPNTVNVGDANTAAITIRSSVNTGKSRTALLRTGVPAPFAQVYRDDADGAMSLYLAQPDAQIHRRTTSNGHYGYNMAVAEMPNSFAYVWNKYHWPGSVGTEEIEYTLLDRYGNTVRGVSKLTDHNGATVYTHDYPVVAVAPNGRIGVIWYRNLWNSSTSQSNDNVYFAILDSSGNLTYGPVNLTNNNAWGTWSDQGVPWFDAPRITATGDNRFVLAWRRYTQESGSYPSDVYYAVRDANGGTVKGMAKFTGDGQYYDPALTSLSGNRALLAYEGPNGISYAVLDSAGNTVKGETPTGGDGWGPDAVQLSDGTVLLAWTEWGTDVTDIRFAVLNSTTYNVSAGPTALDNPAALTGDDCVSVAADAAGHGILTWVDNGWNYRPNLYYALVDGSGNVLTDPMIFRTSQATSPRIETSYEGYGNTSYSLITPTTNNVDAKVTSSLVGGAPGGTAGIPATVRNYGLTTATSVVLTATLDSNLGYVGALPAPASVETTTVVWVLDDLDYLGEGRVALYTSVPSTTIGTRYPITWTVTSAGTEFNPSDNTTVTEVMVALQVFLPIICRGY